MPCELTLLEKLSNDHSNSVEIMISEKPKCILQRLLIKCNLPLKKSKKNKIRFSEGEHSFKYSIVYCNLAE